MRAPVVLAFAVFAGCSSTTFAEPRILVSPYLALYQLRGDASMQSEPTPGNVQNNPAQSMRTFGHERHKEDIGVRADIGDGFAGARIDWCQLDMNTSHTGVLGADWGRLLAGDVVRAKVSMDELRLSWLESIGTMRTQWRDQPLTVRFAGGFVLAHRDLDVNARTDDGQFAQNLEIEGDTVYAAVRLRASWREYALDLDYAVCPELELRGDFDGVLHDLELRGSWTMPMQDATFFAGYRLSTFEGRGDANGFDYVADFTLDGFQLGLTVTF